MQALLLTAMNDCTMRRGRNTAFRVSSGGQTSSFNTLNGDVYVRKADR
jgi:hypothetical protein